MLNFIEAVKDYNVISKASTAWLKKYWKEYAIFCAAFGVIEWAYIEYKFGNLGRKLK